jgi:hypothetical protein
MRPPHSGAITMPAVWTHANVPMLRPRRSDVLASASAASSSGLVNAFDAPCSERIVRNAAIPGASAAPNDVSA